MRPFAEVAEVVRRSKNRAAEVTVKQGDLRRYTKRRSPGC